MNQITTNFPGPVSETSELRPTARRNKSEGRNQTLDVIRGLLSWVVVAVHAVWFGGGHGTIQAAGGIFAVNGFVILSGFVITQLLVTKNETYGVFIFRRFMRLFPAFAVCVAFALLVRPFTFGTASTEALREASEGHFFWWHLGAHASLLHGLIPALWLPESQFAFLPPGWSISLEFQLYLVAPFVLWWIARFGLKGFVCLAIVSTLMFWPPIAWRVSYVWSNDGGFLPQKFFFFLIGMMIYLFLKGAGKSIRYWAGFVRLGEVSYSTYLVHYPILACLNVVIPGQWPMMERAALLFAAAAPITLLCSFLLYRFVERPGIALGRRLTTRKPEVRSPKLSVDGRHGRSSVAVTRSSGEDPLKHTFQEISSSGAPDI